MGINPLEVDLHDAIMEKILFGFSDGSLEICLRYYGDAFDKERVAAKILFKDVEFSSCVLDYLSLINNSRSGNINYWSPSLAGETTYIYFVDGFLHVKAKNIKFIVES